MYHRAGLFNIRLPLVRRRQDFCERVSEAKQKQNKRNVTVCNRNGLVDSVERFGHPFDARGRQYWEVLNWTEKDLP